jgi:membrane associated rhomboid family serine protease
MYRGRTLSLSLPPFTRAVKWLVLVNAGVFLFMTILGLLVPELEHFLFQVLALTPRLVMHGLITQLATYSFLHAGLFHILFNMLWLWMFGSQFEMDWGPRRFLELYFFSVVGAALTTVAVSYTGLGGISDLTRTVGASGGVFGILMAFGMVYGNQEIFLFPFPISIRAKYFVGILIFIEIISALQAARGRGEAVAYFAHFGGILFGYLYVRFIPRRGLVFKSSERYFGLRNAYHRWKRRRAARKFEVYMRKEHHRTVSFDEHGNYIPPDEDKKDGGSKSGWVN